MGVEPEWAGWMPANTIVWLRDYYLFSPWASTLLAASLTIQALCSVFHMELYKYYVILKHKGWALCCLIFINMEEIIIFLQKYDWYFQWILFPL
jgi:hypothetical protein